MIIVATVDNLKDLRNYHQVFPQQQWKLMTIHVTGKHKNLTKKSKTELQASIMEPNVTKDHIHNKGILFPMALHHQLWSVARLSIN